MKTTSLLAVAAVVSSALVFIEPAFAQHVIGNIYPDSTDSGESPEVRDPGNASDFDPYSLSEPDLARAPRESADSEPAPMAGSLSRGFAAPESSNNAWMQRPEGAFAQPWVNPPTSANLPMRESSPVFSSSPGAFRPFH